MGDGYDLGQSIASLGQTFGQILQDRFNAHQAQDFINTDLAQFQQATAAFYQGIGEIEDPDTLAQAFTDWKNNTFMPFMTRSAVKYSGNPMIMGILQRVDEGNRNGLDNYLSIQDAAYERSQRGAQEQRQAAETELIGAQAGTQRERQRLLRAQRQQIEEEAQAQQAPSQMKNLIVPPGATWAEARMFIKQAPLDRAEAIDKQTLNRAALRYIEQNRGKNRGDGRVWGETPQGDETTGVISDAALAKRLIGESPIYPRLLEMERGRAWVGEEFIANAPEGYFDATKQFLYGGSPTLPEESAVKMAGDQDDRTVISMLTGSNPRSMPETWTSIDSFIDETVREADSPEQLGPFIQSVFDEAVERDEFGKVRSADGTVIEDYEGLIQALTAQFGQRVTRQLVEPTTQSAPTRKKVNRIGIAAIQKFAPIIAQRMGIEVPRKPVPPSDWEILKRALLGTESESQRQDIGVATPEEERASILRRRSGGARRAPRGTLTGKPQSSQQPGVATLEEERAAINRRRRRQQRQRSRGQ